MTETLSKVYQEAQCSALSDFSVFLQKSRKRTPLQFAPAVVDSLMADGHAAIVNTYLLAKQVNSRMTDSPGVVVGVDGHADCAH